MASSNISAVGSEDCDLYIASKKGRVYRYIGLLYAVYMSLMSAPLHGRFLNTYIRNVYPYQQLR